MSVTGDRLRKRRKELDLSADDVAYELGVSRSTIFKYENGYIEKVPANIIEDLARILYTTPEYLMGWDDDPHDYERIANDEGMAPPNDVDIPIKDWVKMKWATFDDTMVFSANKPDTLAAHFNGDEYTKEELEEIRKFAEFVKSKRK